MYPCSICNKQFRTKEGRDMHKRTHPAEYDCSICNKQFRTTAGRDMHERNHPITYECTTRNKSFRTEHRRDMHATSVHRKVIKKTSGFPPPPVESAGEWVLREDFPGKKSFGFFKCTCDKTWLSAHAYKIYEQGCKTCEDFSKPVYMWVNNDVRVEPKLPVTDETRPHDKTRCEACSLGLCDALKPVMFRFL